MGVIDFHAHAFPDSLAERAIGHLVAEARQKTENIRAYHGGRVSDLLRSMDEAGIDTSVICSIATRPSQFEPILEWSRSVNKGRIVALPSFHPSDGDPMERIRRIAGEGFKGVKFHPYYQDFFLAEDRMLRIFEGLLMHDMLIVMHTGYDIAFERIRRADPAQILDVYRRFPEIKLITTHLGAWEQWDEVEDMLIGKPIYMELSFAVEFLGKDMKRLIEGHPREFVLFGTDSPWTGQRETLDAVRALGLANDHEGFLLEGNARRLLGL